MVFSILFYLFIIISFVLMFMLKKQNKKLNLSRLTKILGFTMLGVILIKAWAADGMLRVINGGIIYQSEDYVKVHDFGESFVRIALLALECMFLSLMVSNNKRVKWILAFVGLPLFAFTAIYFPRSVQYFLNPIKFQGIYFVKENAAAILLILEYVLLFLGLLLIYFFDDYKLTKEDIRPTIKTGVFSLIVCIPFYVFATIFGTTNIIFGVFNIVHIAWILSIPLLYILILLLFKKEDEKTRFSVLATIVFYMVIHMTCFAKVGYRSSRFPLQPCNIAPYICMLLLFTKNKRIFNCLSIANPTGAFIGILATDTGNIFNFWMSHYVIEHTYVFMLPLLFVRFGFMERDNFKKVIKDFFICIAVYGTFCLLLDCIHNGLIMNAINNEYINDINFFFLIECPLDLPFLGALQSFGFKLFGQMIYPLYILFIVSAYSVLSFILYFISVGFTTLTKLTKKLVAKK